MSALNFVRSAIGLIVPEHCGKVLKFGIITSRCSGCNETFDTLDATVEIEKLNGRPVDLIELAAYILAYGLILGAPIDVPAFSLQPKETPPQSTAQELTAEKLAHEAIFKAAGK